MSSTVTRSTTRRGTTRRRPQRPLKFLVQTDHRPAFARPSSRSVSSTPSSGASNTCSNNRTISDAEAAKAERRYEQFARLFPHSTDSELQEFPDLTSLLTVRASDVCKKARVEGKGVFSNGLILIGYIIGFYRGDKIKVDQEGYMLVKDDEAQVRDRKQNAWLMEATMQLTDADTTETILHVIDGCGLHGEHLQLSADIHNHTKYVNAPLSPDQANAQFVYDSRCGEITLVASQNIFAGDEILAMYGDEERTAQIIRKGMSADSLMDESPISVSNSGDSRSSAMYTVAASPESSSLLFSSSDCVTSQSTDVSGEVEKVVPSTVRVRVDIVAAAATAASSSITSASFTEMEGTLASGAARDADAASLEAEKNRRRIMNSPELRLQSLQQQLKLEQAQRKIGQAEIVNLKNMHAESSRCVHFWKTQSDTHHASVIEKTKELDVHARSLLCIQRQLASVQEAAEEDLRMHLIQRDQCVSAVRDEADTQLQQLRSQVTALEASLVSERHRFENTRNRLEARVSYLEKCVKTQPSTDDSHVVKLQQAEARIHALETQAREHDRNMTQIRIHERQWREHSRDAHAVTEQLRQSNEESRIECTRLHAEYQTLTTDNHKLRVDRDQLHGDLKHMRIERDRGRAEIVHLRREPDILRTALFAMEEEMTSLRQSRDNANQTPGKRSAEFSALNTEHQQLKRRFQDMRQTLVDGFSANNSQSRVVLVAPAPVVVATID